MQEGGKIYYDKITKWWGTKDYSKKEAEALNLLKFEPTNDLVNAINTSVYKYPKKKIQNYNNSIYKLYNNLLDKREQNTVKLLFEKAYNLRKKEDARHSNPDIGHVAYRELLQNPYYVMKGFRLKTPFKSRRRGFNLVELSKRQPSSRIPLLSPSSRDTIKKIDFGQGQEYKEAQEYIEALDILINNIDNIDINGGNKFKKNKKSRKLRKGKKTNKRKRTRKH
jgi:hypothetical protein